MDKPDKNTEPATASAVDAVVMWPPRKESLMNVPNKQAFQPLIPDDCCGHCGIHDKECDTCDLCQFCCECIFTE